MGLLRKIKPIVRIDRLDEIDERREFEAYRSWCLALSSEARLAEMRRLSRRIRLLRARDPRSLRTEPIAKITHDVL